jgi:type IV pilus assembly protein PilV
MLEVLVALLIFSLGLLGLAGLLVVSVQTNHSAYLRTQANFLVHGMVDRMRANMSGVWNGSYNHTYTKATGGSAGTCLIGAPCGYADVATRDGLVFSNQLGSFLPNPTSTINCTFPAPTPSADDIAKHIPFTGQCQITLSWTESSLDQGTASNTETLAWIVQP